MTASKTFQIYERDKSIRAYSIRFNIDRKNVHEYREFNSIFNDLNQLNTDLNSLEERINDYNR